MTFYPPFYPLEDRRVQIKKKAHALNQKYNVLTEDQQEERKEILTELLGDYSVVK